jgi:two-component system chemotaxis response regulator CheY
MSQTVLIVDDHDGFRTQARELLEACGYDVIGEAATASSALAVVDALRPDIVLLDVQLPDGNGFDLVDELGKTSRVVMISGRDPATYRSRLASTSALGFIPKAELSRSSLREIVDAPS